VPNLYEAALATAAVGGVARGVSVLYAWVRTLLIRKGFVSFRFGRIELLNVFEPFLLLIAGYLLYRTIESTGPPGAARILLATLGAALVLVGWAVQIWAFLSWPSIFAGHGVLEDHRLVSRGAYAVVRHPAYLVPMLIWLGLGVAFLNPPVIATAILYVIPNYVFYLRAEERMMLESFGDEYRDYRRNVPMLIPRLYRRRSRNGE
jgi:protein-S-isoprenylcysteine O-methyltransferase Ste14